MVLFILYCQSINQSIALSDTIIQIKQDSLVEIIYKNYNQEKHLLLSLFQVLSIVDGINFFF